MIRGKQKTALPAATGKAAIETGIYIYVMLMFPPL